MSAGLTRKARAHAWATDTSRIYLHLILLDYLKLINRNHHVAHFDNGINFFAFGQIQSFRRIFRDNRNDFHLNQQIGDVAYASDKIKFTILLELSVVGIIYTANIFYESFCNLSVPVPNFS